MQRPSNTGGHGTGVWDRSASNYGHENAAFGFALNAQSGAPHYQQGWGQSEQDAPRGPPFSWKSEPQSSQTGTDQTRSFLGTEQWGRESGGAPWGSNPTHAESSEAASSAMLGPRSTDPASNMFPHHDAWLPGGSRTPPVFQVKPEADSKASSQENSLTHSPTEDPADGETVIEKNSGIKSASDGSSPLEEKKTSLDDVQLPPSENLQQGEDATNEGSDDQEKSTATSAEIAPSAAASTSEAEPTRDASSEQVPAPDNNVPLTTQAEASSADTSVGGTVDQLQQLNLMDPYAQQIASQLTGYQLAAMQQHYALAAQQQLAPGMILSSPYFIPAQHGVPAGYDPNSGAPFPMMAQYASYPGWSTYPTMLQQQMAASSVSNTSQQGSSPAVSQSNRPSSEAPHSRSQSPASQAQENVPPQSEFLANMAAMQQSNLNAMAMAGYPVIPSAYYDQTGALIINNGRPGGPVRLYAPGPPVFINGSQHLMTPQLAGANGSMYRFNQAQATQQHVAANMYANQQSMSGGSTPVPSMSQGINLAAQSGGGFGSSSNISNLGIAGLTSGGIGSSSSTPQRRDSFSDYPKHQPGGMSQYGGGFSQFYSSLGVSPGTGVGLGAMSPSPGPLSNVMSHSHHSLNSPPPSMPSPNTGLMLGSNSRMFSAAPGAETKYRNGSYMASGIFGSSGSSLFPPTRIRPSGKDLLMSHGRSKLLDDFRNNRLPNPQLHELVNHIVEFSQDQHGSRFIQQKLERATPQEKQHVFNEIIGAAYQLMTDVFGNYVIQKFFEFGTPEHKLALAGRIRGHVLPLALQMYGCRVIQKALECIPQEQQVEIVKELNGHLLKCVKDQNGNHVVQKCIECVPSVHLQFIVDGFKGQVVGLSSHTYGCRVVQRILEHCTDEQTAPILEELHQHSEMLVKDQYGNYVIQHILERGKAENKSQIVNELRGKILSLSQHKFASNVIEKCVSNSSAANRAWLIDEVCQEPDALFIMMKDQYANYVVQKMLDVAEPQQKKMLIQKIRPHMLALRKFTYGKHIITKLEKFFMKSAQNPGSGGAGSASAADLTGSQLATANWVLENSE